jgi:serine/threonine protein kinase
MTDPEKPADWTPERIGKNRVLGLLGMGGMGVIYKAVQEPINRIVAVKVLPPQFSRDHESSLRFESEAKAISMLQHQNIVQLYEYGEENGSRYFAMQFVEGESLAARIGQKKPMPIAQIIDLTRQVCRGLRYAHSMGVIHRDIKPQNILIDKNEVAHISDFGIAKIVSQNSITLTGLTVGTPEYMSPEQAEGHELTPASDIYSLGVVIYEMLTRDPPFTANNPVAVAYKQVHEIPTPPSVKRPDMPKRLELIVLKAMKKNPKERYQRVDEMLEHLDTVDLNEKVERPTTVLRRGKSSEAETAEPSEQDNRITDRRSAGRRRIDRIGKLPSIASVEYWVLLLHYQWPVLVVLVALAALVIYHLVGHVAR